MACKTCLADAGANMCCDCGEYGLRLHAAAVHDLKEVLDHFDGEECPPLRAATRLKKALSRYQVARREFRRRMKETESLHD